jgi:PhoPQ-activated pathogenicity-related protein
MKTRLRRAAVSVFACCVLWNAPLARGDVETYVKAPDPSFQYTVENSTEAPGLGQVLSVRLTSQTWQGIPWQHWLTILRPEKVEHADIGLLLINGGSSKSKPPSALSKEGLVVAEIARKTGTVVCILSQVPNQPLFGDLKEDGLIAHTFIKYLETRDETWPCLLPMTKSAVRAMDAVQALVKEKFSQELKKFVVTGASKRGWTTWLTGSVDPRVCAIAPMVIDTLNMQKQMGLQRLSFGGYSEQIADYTSRHLPERLADPRAKPLLQLVDPYYRIPKLTLPKLIVLGTNDRYWPVDAVKMYFFDLAGEKLIHYVPNAGHGLGPGAIEAVSAFYEDVVTGKERPRFTWSFKKEVGEGRFEIAATDRPIRAELWSAASPTRDFREAKWAGHEIEGTADSKFIGRLAAPAKGFAALFGRLTFKSSLGHEYALCTNMEVLGDPPGAATN